MTHNVLRFFANSFGLLLLTVFAANFVAAKNQSYDDKNDLSSKNSTKENVKVFSQLPVYFEENRGQSNSTVKFLSRNGGYTLFLTPTEAVYQLQNSNCGAQIVKNKNWLDRFKSRIFKSKPCSIETLKMKFSGANEGVQVEGADLLPMKTNYFIGTDESRWLRGVSSFQSVRYRQIYAGIDAVFRGIEEQNLEYDFHLAPNADPNLIKLEFTGTTKLKISGSGELILKYKGGEIRHRQPVAFQIINGEKKIIPVRFALLGKNLVGFNIGEYDRNIELTIDPIIYATYLGGFNQDNAEDVALGPNGDMYVASSVKSADFLHTEEPAPFPRAGGDIAVTRFSQSFLGSGSGVIYNTYIGGFQSDVAWAIDVDASGYAYIGGQTNSANFPRVNARQTANSTNGGNNIEGFVTKLDHSGGIEYSTYHGSPTSSNDWVESVKADSNGNLYVSGATDANDFPVMNAYQSTRKGPYDGYLSKFNPTGQLLYSTYFGGNCTGCSYPNSNANDVTVDNQGNAFITGETHSTQLPITTGAYKTSGIGYVAKFDTTKTGSESLVYATYIPGLGRAIAKNAEDYVYVASLHNHYPNNDYKIIKLNSSGTGALYAYQINDENFFLNDIAVTPDGKASFTQVFNYESRAEIKSLTAGGNLYGKFSINAGILDARGIAVDTSGYVYVAGATFSRSFPVTFDAFQWQNRGNTSPFATPTQGFLAKVLILPEKTPLIFIPGIAGSSLYEADANGNPIENLWTDGIGELNGNKLGKLALNTTNPTSVVAVDSIREISQLPSFLKKIYGPLLEELHRNGYDEYDIGGNPKKRNPYSNEPCTGDYNGEHPNLFVFAYDWRKSNVDAANQLKQFVDCVGRFYPNKKVNILTHSMGGLLTRRYILDHPSNHNIDKLITMVAPWLGAPRAIDALLTKRFIGTSLIKGMQLPGGAQGGIYLHQRSIGNITPYSAGAHELLPSEWYFDLGGRPFALQKPDKSIQHYSYEEVFDLINAKFPTPPPYENAAAFHNYLTSNQDDWSADVTGIKYFHLYGQQSWSNTPTQIISVPRLSLPLNPEKIKFAVETVYSLGDGTVPSLSAARSKQLLAPNTTLKRCSSPSWFNDDYYEHNGITQNPVMWREILAIINDTAVNQPECVIENLSSLTEGNSQENTSDMASSPGSSVEINLLKVYNVNRIEIADEFNNTNTPINEFSEKSVPGINYEYGSSSSDSLIVPHQVNFAAGKIVDFKFTAFEEPISIELYKGSNREISTSAIKYLDLQLPFGVKAWLKFSTNGVENLRYDADGDGLFETEVQPTLALTSTSANDRTPPNIDVSFAANNNIGTVTVNATDNETGINKIRYIVQGETSDHVYTSPFTIDLTQSKLIYVSAEDNAGNRNLLAKWIDLVPPTSTTILTPAANSTGWNNSDITVELKSLDDLGGSGIKSLTYNATGTQPIPEETINKKEAPFTFPQPSTSSNFLSKSLNFSTEGVSTLNFFGKDFAGNTEANKTRVIKIDKTLPVTTHSLSVNGSDVTFTLTASDILSGVSEIYYTIDGGGAQVYTSPFTVSNNAYHTITYYAKDNAGNIESPRTLFNISGAVTYGTTPANQPAKFVSGVQMSASGASSTPATTDLTGSYQLQYLVGGGQYTVTPSKSGDINGISPFDATLILQCVAAGTTNCTLTANQKLAADTNGSGDISPFDATQILRFVAAGGPVPGGYTGNVGNWKFDPISRSYPALNGNMSDQSHTAILTGEVNGSWTPPTSFALIINQQNSPTNTIQISMPQNAAAVKDSNVSIPVSFSKSDNNVTVRSYSFHATFDPLVLQPQYAGIYTTGTLTQGCSLTTNIATPGKIGVASSCPISAASGTLINLYFKVVGEANTSTGTTPLTFLTTSEDTPTPWFEDTNNNPILIGLTNGQFTVTPPAAANSDDSILNEKSKDSSEGVAASTKAFVPEPAQQQQQQQPGAEGGIQISLPENAATTTGSVVTIPVTLINSGGTQLSAYSFDVQFNPALLKAVEIIDTSGTLSSNCFVEANTIIPGRINIAGSCGNSISASAGTLVKLRFTVVGQANNAASEARALRFWQTPVFEDHRGNRIEVSRKNGSIR